VRAGPRSIHFRCLQELAAIAAPRAAPEETRLFVEPVEEIKLLGLMASDTLVIAEKLNGLPAAGDGYRGDLRVVVGAARRLVDRAIRLLGETETQ